MYQQMSISCLFKLEMYDPKIAGSVIMKYYLGEKEGKEEGKNGGREGDGGREEERKEGRNPGIKREGWLSLAKL